MYATPISGEKMKRSFAAVALHSMWNMTYVDRQPPFGRLFVQVGKWIRVD
jgi:hypothetical protein